MIPVQSLGELRVGRTNIQDFIELFNPHRCLIQLGMIHNVRENVVLTIFHPQRPNTQSKPTPAKVRIETMLSDEGIF